MSIIRLSDFLNIHIIFTQIRLTFIKKHDSNPILINSKQISARGSACSFCLHLHAYPCCSLQCERRITALIRDVWGLHTAFQHLNPALLVSTKLFVHFWQIIMHDASLQSHLQMHFQHKMFYFKIFKALMKPLHNTKKLEHHTPTRFVS